MIESSPTVLQGDHMATETTSLPQSQSELSLASTWRQFLHGLAHSEPTIAYPKNQEEIGKLALDLERLYGQLQIGLIGLKTLPEPQQRVVLLQVEQILQNVGALSNEQT